MRKVVSIIFFTVLFFVSLGEIEQNQGQATSHSKYVDFDSQKWWNDEFKWGLQEGIINGYYDNDQKVWRIKPEATITEAEFITIALRQMAESDLKSATSNSWWASASYDVANEYNLPTNSQITTSTAQANAPITRGRTARIMAKMATGELMRERDAVSWLYSIGFQGRSATEKTYESYGPKVYLTRAEAVTFIKRLFEKGFTEIVSGYESKAAPKVIGIQK